MFGPLKPLTCLAMTLAVAAWVAGQDARSERIDRIVDAHLAATKASSVSVAISVDGQMAYTKAFGFADLEHRVPATPETVYRLASISKPLTAVAIMKLVEEGKLGLDEDIRRYVPEFPEKPWPVTIRQLLTHTSGVRHYRAGEVENTSRITQRTVALRRFADDPLSFEPGTQSLYSTYAYELLAAAIETVTGKTFAESMRDLVFSPAGMEHTRMDDAMMLIPNRARGYRNIGETVVNSEFADTSYKFAGGGMVSTPTDLCRLGSALLSGRILRPETRDAMWTKQRLTSGEELTRSLGWGIYQTQGEQAPGHSGAQQGSRTLFIVYPKAKTVIAVLTSFESHDVNALFRQIEDAWFGAPSG